MYLKVMSFSPFDSSGSLNWTENLLVAESRNSHYTNL